MNTRERFVNVLTGQCVDRVPFIKVFGSNNTILPEWSNECPDLKSNIDRILKFEGTHRGWEITPVNFRISQREKPVLIRSGANEDVYKFPDGTIELRNKGTDYHSQTLEWPIKNRQDWGCFRDKYLQAEDTSRLPADWPEMVKKYKQRDYPLALSHGGVYGFARRYLMGDEALMYTFYDDPGLVHEIMDYYTDMVIKIWERMVGDVEFDLIECWEDMASKNGCLISPETFREFIAPNYRKIATFAKNHGIKIILVDSDGYIDDLAGLMLETGVTAMYPFEVNAGCDIKEIRRRYPTLGIIGGLNKQVMAGSKNDIDQEVEKAREYIKMGRYIPGPDHFVLSDVCWENYKYFMERLRDVVSTTLVSE